MAFNVFEMFGTISAKDNASKVIDSVTEKARKADHTLSNGLAKIGSVASGIGGTLTKYITAPAVGATTALAGIALKKGWDRLTGIDDARAKLYGLGHDAGTVEKIMNSALESVKGTSFGMDEAATTAANAVAAGIEPGQKLTKYLQTTADAAAIAGVSMSEMGAIVNKVQTGQKAYTENLEQLSDRGIPIYQWLAKEAGVAAGEVKDLASSGKISSEMFMNAIEKNIGGAAAIMGDKSFTASLKNMWAAVGRIGANFLDAGGKGGGFFSQLKPLVSEMTDMLGNLEAKASDFGVKFGAAFKQAIDFILDMKAKFDGLNPPMQNFILKSAGMWAGIAVGAGPALKVFGKFSTGLSTILKGIETMNGGIMGLFTKLGSGLTGVVPKLLSFSGLFLSILGPAAIGGALLAGLGIAQTMFGDQLDTMFQTAQTKGPNIIIGLTNGITSKLPLLIENGTKLLNNFLETLTANAPALIQGGVLILFTLISGFANSIPQIIPVVLNLANVILTNLIGMAPILIQAGLNLLLALAQGISENLPTLIEMVGELIPLIITKLATMLPMLIDTGIEILVTLAKGIIDSIPALLEAIPLIWNALSGAFDSINWDEIGQKILDGIFEVFSSLGSMLADVFSPVTDWLTQKKEEISNDFSDMSDSAKQAWEGTKEFFSDLWSGVEETFANISSWMSTAPGNAAETIKGKWEGTREFFSGLWQSVVETTTTMWNSLVEIFGPYVEAILVPFQPIIEFFSGLWTSIQEITAAAWEIIKSVVMAPVLFLIDLITGDFGQLQQDLSLIWTTIQQNALIIFSTIKETVIGYIRALVDTISNLWSIAAQFLMNTWNNIKTTAVQTWSAIKQWITDTVTSLVNGVIQWWNNLKQRTAETFSALVSGAKNTWSDFKNWLNQTVTNIVNSAKQKWEDFKSGTVQIFNNLVDGAKRAWDNLSSSVKKVVDDVKGFFGRLKDINLFEAGQAIIDGFLGGLKQKYEDVKSFIGGIADWIRDHKGPIDYDRKLLIPAGDAIMSGLNSGLDNGFGSVKSNVSSMADRLRQAFGTADFEVNSLSNAGVNSVPSQNVDRSQADMIVYLQSILEVLYLILEKDPDIILDGDSIVAKLKERISRELAKMNKDAVRNSGLQPVPN